MLNDNQYVSFKWLLGQTLILIGTIITAVALVSGSVTKSLDLKVDKSTYATSEKALELKVDKSLFDLQTRILCSDIEEIKRGVKELTAIFQERERVRKH
jgi:hypothetical protein